LVSLLTLLAARLGRSLAGTLPGLPSAHGVPQTSGIRLTDTSELSPSTNPTPPDHSLPKTERVRSARGPAFLPRPGCARSAGETASSVSSVSRRDYWRDFALGVPRAGGRADSLRSGIRSRSTCREPDPVHPFGAASPPNERSSGYCTSGQSGIPPQVTSRGSMISSRLSSRCS
jgi:hypothetical protein